MDILYYSNYCKYSNKLIQYLAKNNLTNKLNCINIDKRTRNPNTNQTLIHLENGTTVQLPPNVHSVPSLLLVKDKYAVIIGEEIYQYLSPKVSVQNAVATNNEGEPEAYIFAGLNSGGVNIMSEQYTYYDMSPDELSAKGRGGMRQMYNYMPAMHDGFTIPTPPDNYRPDKVTNDSLEELQMKRNAEVANQQNPVYSAGLDPAYSIPPPAVDPQMRGSNAIPNAIQAPGYNPNMQQGGMPSYSQNIPQQGMPAYNPSVPTMQQGHGMQQGIPTYNPSIPGMHQQAMSQQLSQQSFNNTLQPPVYKQTMSQQGIPVYNAQQFA